jgi:gas vesicle protein
MGEEFARVCAVVHIAGDRIPPKVDTGATQMNAPTPTPEPRHFAFALGLAAGAVVGVGVAMWLAPRMASEIRERLTGSARDLGARASEHVERTSSRVVDAVGDVSRIGRGVRDEVAAAVSRGVHEVRKASEQLAP